MGRGPGVGGLAVLILGGAALVLKAMTITLQPILPISRSCVHVKGHGGAKEAVRRVARNVGTNRFVMRTDVKSFYASIDHHILLDCLAVVIKENAVLNLIGQYLRRTVEIGDRFFDYERGISLGCPLSPLMGAFYLTELDRRVERLGLFYVRFMDDILLLAPTRWKLRAAVKAVNEMLQSLRLEKHPDKTFIGRIERGFDFLGHHFSRRGLTLARSTIEKFVERTSRLYEQEAGGTPSPVACLQVTCPQPCAADVDGDGTVGILDFLDLLAAWGDCS